MDDVMTVDKLIDIDAIKAEASAKTGIDQTKIRSVKVQLDALRKQGILVDLEVCGTSMFTRSTTWLELGIQPDQDDPRVQRFTRGYKFLIPEDEVRKLKSVETSMRTALDYYSQDITGFRPYRWIPYTAYPAWRERWEELLDRFNSIKTEIIGRYDDYLSQLVTDFSAVAEAAWSSLERQGYTIVVMDRVPYEHNQFVEIVVRDAVSKFPSKAFVEQNLKADYITALVFGQEEIEADHARAFLIKSHAEAEINAERLKNEHDYEQLRHEAKTHYLEEQEREAKIEAMWRAEIEHAREQLGTIVSPYQEVFASLRNRLAQDAEEMLASIKKNGFVRGKVAEKGRGLIELYDMMSTHDDIEFRKKLVALRVAIGPSNKERTEETPERSTQEVQTILNEICDLAHQASQDLQNGPSRFSFIE